MRRRPQRFAFVTAAQKVEGSREGAEARGNSVPLALRHPDSHPSRCRRSALLTWPCRRGSAVPKIGQRPGRLRQAHKQLGVQTNRRTARSTTNFEHQRIFDRFLECELPQPLWRQITSGDWGAGAVLQRRSVRDIVAAGSAEPREVCLRQQRPQSCGLAI